MLLETLSSGFRKARPINYTTNGYPTKIPTTTEPVTAATATATSAAVIEIGYAEAQNAAVVVPYGAGADNTTLSVRVIGWRRVRLDGSLDLWVPVTLGEFACTLGAILGVAGAACVATDRFADTITVTKGSTLSGEAPSENVVSLANDTVAHFVIDVKGFQKIELVFTTGGSATDCNALVALI